MFEHFFLSPVNSISTCEEKKKLKNFQLFLYMLLKFEIIWMRFGQVIRLQNDINFSETSYIVK